MNTKPRIGDILRLNLNYMKQAFLVVGYDPDVTGLPLLKDYWEEGCWVHAIIGTEEFSWGRAARFYTKIGEATPLQKAVYIKNYE